MRRMAHPVPEQAGDLELKRLVGTLAREDNLDVLPGQLAQLDGAGAPGGRQ